MRPAQPPRTTFSAPRTRRERDCHVVPETVVVAIGGNALAPAGLGDFAGQEERARRVADAAIGLLEADRRLLMVHGNGPQVGALARHHDHTEMLMPSLADRRRTEASAVRARGA